MSAAFATSPALDFEALSFILLDDVLQGRRMMALILEEGDACVLYLDAHELPSALPILAGLNPQPLPSTAVLLQQLQAEDEDEARAFAELMDEVTAKLAPGDDLTVMRALYWAFEHRAWDLDAAVHAALLAGLRARDYETWLLPQLSIADPDH